MVGLKSPTSYPLWKAPGVSSNYRKGSRGYRDCIKIRNNCKGAVQGIFRLVFLSGMRIDEFTNQEEAYRWSMFFQSIKRK